MSFFMSKKVSLDLGKPDQNFRFVKEMVQEKFPGAVVSRAGNVSAVIREIPHKDRKKLLASLRSAVRDPVITEHENRVVVKIGHTAAERKQMAHLVQQQQQQEPFLHRFLGFQQKDFRPKAAPLPKPVKVVVMKQEKGHAPVVRHEAFKKRAAASAREAIEKNIEKKLRELEIKAKTRKTVAKAAKALKPLKKEVEKAVVVVETETRRPRRPRAPKA